MTKTNTPDEVSVQYTHVAHKSEYEHSKKIKAVKFLLLGGKPQWIPAYAIKNLEHVLEYRVDRDQKENVVLMSRKHHDEIFKR